MSVIRVSPEILRQTGRELGSKAEQLRSSAANAAQALQAGPSYDGQFGPQVSRIGLELLARARAQADRWDELSAYLMQGRRV